MLFAVQCNFLKKNKVANKMVSQVELRKMSSTFFLKSFKISTKIVGLEQVP